MSDGQSDGRTIPNYRPVGRVLRYDDQNMVNDARRFLEQAQQRARDIAADAEQAHAEEKQRGYREGYEEGARAVAELLSETSGRIDAYYASLEHDVARLATDIVEKMLGTRDDHQVMTVAAREAISRMRQQKGLRIMVAPADVDAMREALAREAGMQDLVVEADSRLETGRCVLAHDLGFIEAGWQQQLMAIKAGITRHLREAGVASTPDMTQGGRL